jgi:hypothetical protein
MQLVQYFLDEGIKPRVLPSRLGSDYVFLVVYITFLVDDQRLLIEVLPDAPVVSGRRSIEAGKVAGSRQKLSYKLSFHRKQL